MTEPDGHLESETETQADGADGARKKLFEWNLLESHSDTVTAASLAPQLAQDKLA